MAKRISIIDKGQLHEMLEGFKQLQNTLEKMNATIGLVGENTKKVAEGFAKSEKEAKNTASQVKDVEKSTKGAKMSATDLYYAFKNIANAANGIKNSIIKFYTAHDKFKKPMIELARLSFKAEGIGTSLHQVKALGEAMRQFGGDSRSAASHIENLQANIADIEWGGEGGGLGEVAMRYGLDIVPGADDANSINEKLHDLLGNLNAGQQLNVKRLLGLDDATFQLLKSNDYKKLMEEGNRRAEGQLKNDAENKAKEVNATDAARNAQEEQYGIQQSTQIFDTLKQLDQDIINRLQSLEKYSGDIAKAEIKLEQGKALVDGIGSLIKAINGLTTLLGAKSLLDIFGPKGNAGKAAKTAWNLGKSGLRGAWNIGKNVFRWGRTAGMGGLALGAGMAYAMYKPMQLLDSDAKEIERYKKASPEEKKKMREAQKEKFGGLGLTKYFDQADAAEKRKKEEGDPVWKVRSQSRVDDAIAAYKNAEESGDIASSQLLDAWQRKGKGFDQRANASQEQLQKLNNFIAGLSKSQAQDILDELNYTDAKGHKRNYDVDDSTMKLLRERAAEVERTAGRANGNMKEAGLNLATTERAASQSVRPSNVVQNKTEYKDHIEVHVANPKEAEKTVREFQHRHDGEQTTTTSQGSSNAGIDMSEPRGM